MPRSDSSYHIRQALKAALDKPNTLRGKQVDLTRSRKVALLKTNARWFVVKLLKKMGV